ncbi:hypothetical protein QJS10_CPA10g00354 [Acorus calamus]|uniref:Uncharacterized protein n=1 Tax=Acorus calamus TaxID=4465 RepID=A0AAV9DXA4_ACOCL|nr:hypothetical protein QJS10_CPA10g00354 [Acorus calamus]
MDTSIVLSAIVAILVLSASVSAVLADFNVLNYGAIGDGKADNSQGCTKLAPTCGKLRIRWSRCISGAHYRTIRQLFWYYKWSKDQDMTVESRAHKWH